MNAQQKQVNIDKKMKKKKQTSEWKCDQLIEPNKTRPNHQFNPVSLIFFVTGH